MGTNYYARVEPCKTCGVPKQEIHIGKSSAGWTFTFHATEDIRSYKDWLKFLSSKEIRIFDEYDREVSLKKFKDLVESKRNEEHNHAKEYSGGGSYVDNEGNSMSPHDFS